MDDQDRSALFNQLKNFSQRKLKKVETKVVTASGEQLVEKRGAKGLQVLSGSDGPKHQDEEPARKLDLQVGLILPGFLIGSQDVAHDKSSLDSYGVSHILNLDSGIENKFEDDYNYKNINIQDRPDFDLDKVLEECFDFIDDGRHYGNVLVHCSGTIGLSRSTAICIAYLMNKEKQRFDEAFNNVKEARSFVKPNEGFVKQLKEYEVKLRGAQKAKESGIDDPFALRKKQEIEQEKAMVAGAASVKNRMKMFGATLDTGAASNRSKSVSPLPPAPAAAASPTPVASKWGDPLAKSKQQTTTISKSMTPEPRKSWQQETKPGPPPPPPPMPTGLHADDKSMKRLNNNSNSGNRSPLPPPPPPPPGDLLKDSSKNSSSKYSSSAKPATTPLSDRRKNFESSQQPDSPPTSDKHRTVFGRVPPPAMKIKGGLSIEKHDAASDKNLGFTRSGANTPNIDYGYGGSGAFKGADAFGMEASGLRQQNNIYQNHQHQQQQQQWRQPHDPMQQQQRCPSTPLVLHNSGLPQFGSGRPSISSPSQQQQQAEQLEDDRPLNPAEFKSRLQLFERTAAEHQASDYGQLPKRTSSLGPRRAPPVPKQPIGESLRANPFLRDQGGCFNKMAADLQSSLTELNNLIDATNPPPPKPRPAPPRMVTKPPKFTSYITSPPELKRPSIVQQHYEHGNNGGTMVDDPAADEQWKPSASIQDLRSMFEQPQQQQQQQYTKPPRSASPSVLRNSPWQNLSPAPPQVYPEFSDYTIRRTTSTNSGGRSPSSSSTTTTTTSNVRNPYRSSTGFR